MHLLTLITSEGVFLIDTVGNTDPQGHPAMSEVMWPNHWLQVEMHVY
jgi:hypothetical protein